MSSNVPSTLYRFQAFRGKPRPFRRPGIPASGRRGCHLLASFTTSQSTKAVPAGFLKNMTDVRAAREEAAAKGTIPREQVKAKHGL